MSQYHEHLFRETIHGFFSDRPKDSVSDWAVKNINFDEPDNRGPFSLAACEYIREPLDCWGDHRITDLCLVYGSQCRKTGTIMAGTAYTMKHEPTRILWAMPNADLARTFAETRWIPMLKASPPFREFLPTGANRHDMKNLQQSICGSIVNFFGSNSPANLSSNPARVVNMDEVDKFNEGTDAEADAVNLAEQRTKNFSNPKRVLASTPTVETGLIWQALMKSDLRRRFVPCPGCEKLVIFAWSKEYTVLPVVGCEAFVRWDKEAKRKDGWDLDRVEKSARYECPHCGFHIQDRHKTRADRAGVWKPTKEAARGLVGFHLPSMYAPSAQMNVGKLAVKFLNAKNSLSGVRGFINSELAEIYQNQEGRSQRVEVMITDGSLLCDSLRIMTIDVQAVSPFFWFVVRDWQMGPSRLVDFGHVDTWEELREIQLKHGVKDNHVGVDSGDQTQMVYNECVRWGKIVTIQGLKNWVGWLPMKGREKEAKWIDKETKQPKPFILSRAALPHNNFRLSLLEFNGAELKDVLWRLRRFSEPFPWQLNESATEEYFRHIDAEFKKTIYVGRTFKTVEEWTKRSERWPNHGLDCEIMNLAMSVMLKRISWATTLEKKHEQGTTTEPKGTGRKAEPIS